MDIYFNDNYGKLYEKIENGKSIVINYEDENGKIKHQFIKREIPIEMKTLYYDLITPYGYGGPIVLEVYGDKNKLIKGFENHMKKYCIDNNIVSEFVRFHPIVENAIDFAGIYNAEYIRNTLGTNIKDYDDPVQSEFSKSCRKSIRQATKKGITYKITESPDNIDIFKNIYYDTMDRNEASDYYYFDSNYFNKCMKKFKKNILLVEALYENKTIAAGFYFVHNKLIHIHLSGTIREYLYLSPAYILRYGVTLWGKENNYEIIHHGGGRTNLQTDTLYKFKKQFGTNTEFKFYIGTRIWNEEIYRYLVEQNKSKESIKFFPEYRK